MYLIDKEIEEILPVMNITADDGCPFLPEEQIQPCSIDLRLSNVFWTPKGHHTIDLRKSQLMEIAPRRYWRRQILKQGEYITLKPGQLILGRICENFTMPSSLAGKIEGRSSFARMGLMIHCTGDFINPGYVGHMPLQLVNLSPFSIKIFPHIPICQLFLIKLARQPGKLYGERELQSKYMDDDGGPSYWWRDKRIKKLQTILVEKDISLSIQNDILNTIGIQEPAILERFENHVEKSPHSEITNKDFLLDAFSKKEDRRRNWERIKKAILTGLSPTLITTSFAVLIVEPISLLPIIVGVIGIFTVPISVYFFKEDIGEYLGEKELKARRREINRNS